MNFLAPLGFFFALFIPAVIILYLLKLKRIDMPISSTLLWRISLDDLKANTPFQKLKKNLLLFLQLLIIAILTFAVARPVLRLGGLEGQSFIVLLDCSASMSATDVKPSRLQEAKRLAIDLVNDMSVGDRMMVISFGSSASVLTPFEQNKGILRNVIREIRPMDTQTDIEDALRNAVSASKAASNPEVIIISDGRFTIPQEIPVGQLQTRYVPVGESSENVGVIDLVVRKDYAYQQNYEVLVGIQNTGVSEQEVYVELWGEGEAGHVHEATATESADEEQPERKMMDARKLTMGPGITETIVFKDPGTFPEKIEVILDSGDSLKTDDRAVAMIPKEDTISILLVTSDNYYLQRVLNLDPRARLAVTSPGKYTGPGDYDVIVFDSFAPLALIGGNYVFINAIPPIPEWTAGEDKLEMLHIVDWDRFHPLTRYLNLDNLTVVKSQNLGAPGWAETIAESRETPLISAFQHEEIRGVVTSFDLYDSDWPMRVSYPIFFSNLINWFGSGEGLSVFMKKTGDVLVLDPPESLKDKVVLNPPKPLEPREFTFADTMPVYYGDTGLVGVYEYRVGEEVAKRYAINLLSPSESIIAPMPSLDIQGTTVEGDTTAVESNREIWRTLAIIALIVLIIEWLVYVKRAKYAF